MRILTPIDKGKFGGMPQFVEIRSRNFISYTLKVFYNYMQFNKTELPVLLAVLPITCWVQLHLADTSMLQVNT